MFRSEGTALVLIALLLLASTAATPVDAPVLDRTTPRSLAQFGQCFAAIQHDQARPYWFVASEDGGRLSNAASPGVTRPYRLRFTQSAESNRVTLSAPGASPADSRAVAKAVESCS
jgi:hypothetical protein